VSVLVWGCVTIIYVGEQVFVDGNMNHQYYIDIPEQNLLL
jgi:hypothetical protein